MTEVSGTQISYDVGTRRPTALEAHVAKAPAHLKSYAFKKGTKKPKTMGKRKPKSKGK